MFVWRKIILLYLEILSVPFLYSRWPKLNAIIARYLWYDAGRWWLVGQRTLDIASNPNWKYLAERQESAQIKRVIPLWNIITIHSHSAPGPGSNLPYGLSSAKLPRAMSSFYSTFDIGKSYWHIIMHKNLKFTQCHPFVVAPCHHHVILSSPYVYQFI